MRAVGGMRELGGAAIRRPIGPGAMAEIDFRVPAYRKALSPAAPGGS